MHTAAEQTPEIPTADTQTPEQALAHIKAVCRVKRLVSELTMIAAQTRALEALIHCMTPVQSTGDTRLDAYHARERNRQRLAATQALVHIRTVQREKRMRRSMRDKARAKAEGAAAGGVVRSEADGHVDNGSTVATPAPPPQRGRRWSCADSAQDRMRGRPKSPDRPIRTPGANPSPRPSPARREGANPPSRKRSRYKTRKPKRTKSPRTQRR